MNDNRTQSRIAWGAILIAIGVFMLLGQGLGWMKWTLMWPVIIVGVGAIFWLGMLLGGKQAGGLAVPASIITVVGLILFAQNALNRYETWSYAWALIIAAIGFGVFIQGVWSDRANQRKSGLETLNGGLVLFVLFGVLFEFIFSFSGQPSTFSRIFLPAILIALGAVQLLYRIYRLLSEPEGTGDRSLFGPVFLVGLGLIFLLAGLGWIQYDRLWALINLWPLLLIVAGITFLIKGMLKSLAPWIAGLLGLAVVAIMLGVVFYGPQLGLPTTPAWFAVSQDGAVQEYVDGSGNIAEETRSVGSFQKVNLAAVGRLTIIQGEETSFSIKAEDNLLPYLETEVRSGELTIRPARGIGLRPTKTIEYTLTTPNLSDVTVSGAGEVIVDRLKTGDLELKVSGAGSIKLDDLQADDIQLDISGSGVVTLAGQASTLDVGISGAGSLEAGDLQCQDASIAISGLGKATVWPTITLNVKISGAGSVNYFGNPQMEEQVSGVGSVTKIGDK